MSTRDAGQAGCRPRLHCRTVDDLVKSSFRRRPVHSQAAFLPL